MSTVIIGGGPGGYVAAIRLSQLGEKVILIEKDNLGGTCTNLGCIPAKAMLSASHLYSEIIEKSKKFGIKYENLSYETKGIMKHKNKSVTMSKKGIEFLMKKNKIEVKKGTAKVLDKNNVLVKETNEKIHCENIILANGSIPAIFQPFSNVEGIWTSDDIFKMKNIPESITIIGGGVIGLEFATFFSSLGKKVYIVELADHIAPFEDADVADEIKKVLKRKKVEIYEKFKVTSVEKNENGYISKLSNAEGEIELISEKVLLSVGRKPNISEDLINLGLDIERGIKTNKKMRTNIENVYAIGDIRAQIMLAHVASFEGIVAAHNIANKELEMDYSAIPSIVFTNPEIASVGVKEKDVNKDDVIVSKFPVSANGRARTMEEKDGFIKIIADKKTSKILGVTIISPSATDMIMEGVLAVKHGLTIEQLANSVHPHPTLTESVLGAIEGLEGLAIHI
ncbi:dihydrolipoyl dehydrogenase [Tepiditoga spiralis]|uniref:Dihydrolipoyl dehydrogenase n=1 Tax=Tepiditoga spiralis TaxID=2108365 RepID=A0A7G1GC95_9BACT|nr:dihydrolipoyl dehydrogenase [Tepiditoga spiralis]BBE31969.1 dihydrolipoyl dehydrogenase [Tepiditoga spiralis]